MQKDQTEKLKQLYQIYEKPFYHIAFAVLHHQQQAEDAVSDAFYQVMTHLDRIGQPDSPKTKSYMIQIIKHTAINQYRKNARQNLNCTELDSSVFQIADPENELEHRFRKQSLRQILADLFSGISETDRQIILLHCQENKSFKEIAEILNMKDTSVRKRFERARKRMIAKKGESYVSEK